jgi:hypothetical protein
LADELLKSSPAETAAAEQKPAEKSAASTKAA